MTYGLLLEALKTLSPEQLNLPAVVANSERGGVLQIDYMDCDNQLVGNRILQGLNPDYPVMVKSV
jgi:hypothetical protein